MDHTGIIVILEADSVARRSLAELLGRLGHTVEPLADGDEALERLERSPVPHLVLVDLTVPRQGGVYFLQRGRQLAPSCSFIALTHSSTVDTIVEAIREGADHCVPLPAAAEDLAVVVKRALEKPVLAKKVVRAEELLQERLERGNFQQIVGSHPAMQRLLDKTLQAAQSRATVLIHGETGTGKELIAGALHQNSKRSAGPFVQLNCAALSETILESELFGHEKGAFTGATMMRRGRFEQADCGTLFLDEVSEIPLSTQVKLLRFLEERQLERVGGNRTMRVDVRIVAATNRDLEPLVEDKRFREDLYYRLNVVRLEVPPLRARPSDIPLLADHFLHKFAAENERSVTGFSDAALQQLLAHPWPGNVRELQNVVEQAVVLCRGSLIDTEELPLAAAPAEEEALPLLIPGVTLAELERYAILKTMESVGWSPSKAAAILGISRRTIQYRMRQWGMSPKHQLRNDQLLKVDEQSRPE